MFEPGDVVRIKAEYLEPNEDPEKDYIVFTDYGRGAVEVWSSNNTAFGGGIHRWPDYLFYKVGHVDLKDRK